MAAGKVPRVNDLFGDLPDQGGNSPAGHGYGEPVGAPSQPTQGFRWSAPGVKHYQPTTTAPGFAPSTQMAMSGQDATLWQTTSADDDNPDGPQVRLPHLAPELVAATRISGLQTQAVMFNSAAEAEDFLPRRTPNLTVVDDVNVVSDHKAAFIKEVVQAFSSRPLYAEDLAARTKIDQLSINFIKQFEELLDTLGDDSYQQETIMAIATMIIEQVIVLHTEGDTLFQLPARNAGKDNSLTACKRVQACIDAIFRCKGVCIDLVKGRKEGIIRFVATPGHLEKRKYANKQSNADRGTRHAQDHEAAEKWRKLPVNNTDVVVSPDDENHSASPEQHVGESQATDEQKETAGLPSAAMLKRKGHQSRPMSMAKSTGSDAVLSTESTQSRKRSYQTSTGSENNGFSREPKKASQQFTPINYGHYTTSYFGSQQAEQQMGGPAFNWSAHPPGMNMRQFGATGPWQAGPGVSTSRDYYTTEGTAAGERQATAQGPVYPSSVSGSHHMPRLGASLQFGATAPWYAGPGAFTPYGYRTTEGAVASEPQATAQDPVDSNVFGPQDLPTPGTGPFSGTANANMARQERPSHEPDNLQPSDLDEASQRLLTALDGHFLTEEGEWVGAGMLPQ